MPGPHTLVCSAVSVENRLGIAAGIWSHAVSALASALLPAAQLLRGVHAPASIRRSPEARVELLVSIAWDSSSYGSYSQLVSHGYTSVQGDLT